MVQMYNDIINDKNEEIYIIDSFGGFSECSRTEQKKEKTCGELIEGGKL